MSDLISRKALLEKSHRLYESYVWEDDIGVDAVDVSDIEAAPSVEAVPVVRCKDCRHCKPVVNENCEVVGCWCDEFEIVDVAENHFCSRGERKDGADDPHRD